MGGTIRLYRRCIRLINDIDPKKSRFANCLQIWMASVPRGRLSLKMKERCWSIYPWLRVCTFKVQLPFVLFYENKKKRRSAENCEKKRAGDKNWRYPLFILCLFSDQSREQRINPSRRKCTPYQKDQNWFMHIMRLVAAVKCAIICCCGDLIYAG